MITEWVKEKARTPVLVKLTPNITRHSHRGARGQARRRRRTLRHQHHQLNHRHRSRHVHAAAQRGWQELARRLLRPGRQAHRAEHGAAGHGRSRIGAAALGHWRHWHLARRRGVHPAGLRHGAGVHRRDALRLSHCGGHGRGPRKLDARPRASRPSKSFAASRSIASPNGSI